MGTLTGQTFKMADPQTQRLLDEWRYFYPVNLDGISVEPFDPVVEVLLCEYSEKCLREYFWSEY